MILPVQSLIVGSLVLGLEHDLKIIVVPGPRRPAST